MHTVTIDEFLDAVETLELLTLSSKEDLRRHFLRLSRRYHPDMSGGDAEKFRAVREAYEILEEYMDNFRFVLDAEEFKRQNPVLVSVADAYKPDSEGQLKK